MKVEKVKVTRSKRSCGFGGIPTPAPAHKEEGGEKGGREGGREGGRKGRYLDDIERSCEVGGGHSSPGSGREGLEHVGELGREGGRGGWRKEACQ